MKSMTALDLGRKVIEALRIKDEAEFDFSILADGSVLLKRAEQTRESRA